MFLYTCTLSSVSIFIDWALLDDINGPKQRMITWIIKTQTIMLLSKAIPQLYMRIHEKFKHPDDI